MARKDDYKPGEKFSAEMAPAFPNREKVTCKDCAFRKKGMLGEINAFCEMYASGSGKPYSVLFQNDACQFKKQEA